MGQMLVFTNAVDGRDDEFNDWYDNVHLGEVCELPMFTGATRFELASGQSDPAIATHRYLAVYEYEGPSEEAVAAIKVARKTFALSDSMEPGPRVLLYEAR